MEESREYTGGRFQPDPRAVFESCRRSIETTLRFGPGLLALALSLAKLVMRKWKGVTGVA